MVDSSFVDLEELKLRVRKMAEDRDWVQFHTPHNLVHALSGECGELNEAFQYKKDISKFSFNDIVHVGEELSDVLIYSTRLCDVCNFNFPKGVKFCLQHKENSSKMAKFESRNFFLRSSSSTGSSVAEGSLLFTEMETILRTEVGKKSPRELVMQINVQLGEVCRVLGERTEGERDSSQWSKNEIDTVVLAISKICILLVLIARSCQLQLGRCAAEKMTKNEKKYPVHLSKGSAAKYTAYVDKIQKENFLSRSSTDSRGIWGSGLLFMVSVGSLLAIAAVVTRSRGNVYGY